jgi:hypothetical protein
VPLEDEVLPEPLQVAERHLLEGLLGVAEERPGDVPVLLDRARAPLLRLEHPLEPADELVDAEDRRRLGDPRLGAVPPGGGEGAGARGGSHREVVGPGSA